MEHLSGDRLAGNLVGDFTARLGENIIFAGNTHGMHTMTNDDVRLSVGLTGSGSSDRAIGDDTSLQEDSYRQKFGEASERHKIIIFVGDNLIGELTMNRVVPQIISMGIEPVLYLTEGPKLKAADRPHMKYFDFYLGKILKNVVHPYLERNPVTKINNGHQIDHLMHPMRNFPEVHAGCQVHEVQDVNSPDIIDRVRGSKRLKAVLSVKSYPIFKDLVQAVDEKDVPFINFHTGLLPRWQGVHIASHGAYEGMERQGWSAHRIIYVPDAPHKGIDAGPIMDTRSGPFNPAVNTIIGEEIGFIPNGADFMVNTVGKILDFSDFSMSSLTPQDPNSATYNTFPQEALYYALRERGIKVVNGGELADILVSQYSIPNTDHGRNMREAIHNAQGEFEHAVWPKIQELYYYDHPDEKPPESATGGEHRVLAHS